MPPVLMTLLAALAVFAAGGEVEVVHGDEDERRVRRMLEHLDRGVSAAEAARLARTEREGVAYEDAEGAPALGAIGAHLRLALDEFDEAAAQSV
jgi:hypothetical protein